MVLAEGDSIGLAEFPQIAAQISAPPASPAEEPLPEAPAPDLDPPASMAAPMPDLPPPSPTAAEAGTLDLLPLFDAEGDIRPLEAIEADIIRYAITHYRGQMSEVARRLQIGRSTLYRKLDALGLNGENAEGTGEAVAAERQPQKIA